MQRSWLFLGDGVHLPLATFQKLDFGGIDLVTLFGCQIGMAGAVGDDSREIEGLPALITVAARKRWSPVCGASTIEVRAS